jgi:hypothetical protein
LQAFGSLTGRFDNLLNTWLTGALPLGHAACTPVRVLAARLSELRRRQARIVAFITEAAPVERILTPIGEPPRPPAIAPARGPPAWDDGPADAVRDWDASAQLEPEYLFDQQVQW